MVENLQLIKHHSGLGFDGNREPKTWKYDYNRMIRSDLVH